MAIFLRIKVVLPAFLNIWYIWAFGMIYQRYKVYVFSTLGVSLPLIMVGMYKSRIYKTILKNQPGGYKILLLYTLFLQPCLARETRKDIWWPLIEERGKVERYLIMISVLPMLPVYLPDWCLLISLITGGGKKWAPGHKITARWTTIKNVLYRFNTQLVCSGPQHIRLDLVIWMNVCLVVS